MRVRVSDGADDVGGHGRDVHQITEPAVRTKVVGPIRCLLIDTVATSAPHVALTTIAKPGRARHRSSCQAWLGPSGSR